MKKQLTGILAAALILGIGVTNVFAAGPGQETQFTCSFSDADGDGVCDLCGRIPGTNGCGGYDYTDADQDGVCDYYAEGACHRTSAGRGHGHGCHRRVNR